jgi:hypothetical protein
MPDVSTDATTGTAETSTAPVDPAAAPPAWHGVSRSAPPSRPERQDQPASHSRKGRRRLRWLRIVVLVIALPVAAAGIGLLIAWIVHAIRGNPTTAPAATKPAPSTSASTAPSPSPAAPRVVVPADWVAESDPPAGITYRHPAGWIRRTALPEILRFAPVATGSTTPGIEGIGAGIEATADPSQALQQFVTRAYAGQPQVQNGPITAVAGGHPGEKQEVVTYTRSGVPVQVVVHAFASSGRSVVVLARAASAQPARAAQLEAIVGASLQITG